jgi:hypothetical protein
VTKLQWDVAANRRFETGLDHGVLYLPDQDGVPWNGLTSVVVHSSGENKPYYMDGEIYLTRPTVGDFQATITAYTFPDEFYQCNGSPEVRPGLYASRQRRKKFNLSFRTKQGNALVGTNYGYKIHLIYNALVNPSESDMRTLSDSPAMGEFSWDVTAQPDLSSTMRPTAYVVIDSLKTNPTKLQSIEDILYGTDDSQPQMPTLAELVTIYDDPLEFTLTDHGNGTYTVLAPNSNLEVLSSGQFIFDWPTAVPVDADSFIISD